VARNVGFARNRSGVGNVGMMRLLDLHAAACAGDTLVMIGLANTIFFNVPVDAARGRVGLYLLVTMVPFALLAPLVGPLLDRFRHGRRYALATTMLGRGLLAWIIADNIGGVALYPAAFGVLALSRAYGVARSAAVPRLLPRGLGLSEAGARASVYGTVAGAIVAPIGLLAFSIGPQWPLRVAAIIFAIGMLIAMNLPAKADSDPPEKVPRIFQLPWRHRAENGDKVLSGGLVLATLGGSAALRALYGFLLLFLAFSIRAGDVRTAFNPTTALGLVGGALALGTFLATAVGSRLRIHRPLVVQAGGLTVVTVAAVTATIQVSLSAVLALCLATAIASGLAKLSVDAVIQERIPETVRASAFAHSETLLMLAWVAGGAVGLIPLSEEWGLGLAAGAILVAAGHAIRLAVRMRADVLNGRADASAGQPPSARPATTTTPKGATSPEYAAGAPAVTEFLRRGASPPAARRAPAERAEEPAQAQVSTETGQQRDDEAPPGFHIFRPSPPDDGVRDPRSGP
jgi:MFS family permease